MCRLMIACIRVGVALLLAAGSAAAQAAGDPSGHWVGLLPAGPGLEVEIDLAKKGDVWHGTMSVPAQGMKGVPLANVAVKGASVSFAITGAPGEPRYSGTLSPDGKSIAGTFSQGGGDLPLTLGWKGAAKFEVAQKSTPITKDLEGSWEGTLDVKGSLLRLGLKLTNDPAGAKGTLISFDQGNAELPIATITQEGARVKLLVTMISGTFDGELKGGELAGTWVQGPLNQPLVFKRPAK